ncbi:MAG: hypothetical protein CSB01_00275 [Bacteroidia bacterium]|nr:MAG: hypothetical protein CSB01_00275 [Bacteroidia bacterium]
MKKILIFICLLLSFSLVFSQEEEPYQSLEDMMAEMQKNDTIYKVQFYSSVKYISKFKDVEKEFGTAEYVTSYKYQGLFRYTFGEYHNDPEAAKVLKKKLIKLGYTDAFIVAFKGGERLFDLVIYKKYDF